LNSTGFGLSGSEAARSPLKLLC